MARTVTQSSESSTISPREMLLPLVLAQFLCSFAGTTMNVAITNIATDLGTSVSGVQTAITLFTLTMAALMIPGSKWHRWAGERCVMFYSDGIRSFG